MLRRRRERGAEDREELKRGEESVFEIGEARAEAGFGGAVVGPPLFRCLHSKATGRYNALIWKTFV